MLPTLEQYRSYRAEQRKAVSRIVRCLKTNTIPKTEWAIGVICRARANHTASFTRQKLFGYRAEA